MKYLKKPYTDNVVLFKFDSRSVQSYIKAKNPKPIPLNENVLKSERVNK